MRNRLSTLWILVAAAGLSAAACAEDLTATAPVGQPRLRGPHEEFLRGVLVDFTHGEPAERRDAFDRMARAGTAAIPFLLDALREASDPLLRRGVLFTLGRLGGEEALAVLRETLVSDRFQDEERTVAALLLGRLGDVVSIPAMADTALSRRPSMFRRAAILAVGRLKDGEGVDRLLEHFPKEGLVEDQVAVLLAAGLVADRAWLPRIVRWLEDRPEPVRRAAVHAIGRIADPAALPCLLSAFEREDDEAVAAAILLVLGGFEDSDSLAALAARLDARDDAVRYAAFAALGARRDGGAILEQWFLPSRKAEDRAQVAAAVASGASWAPLRARLEDMLTAHQVDVRSAAGLTLAAYGGDGSVQAVLNWVMHEQDERALADALVAAAVLGIEGARARLDVLRGPQPLVDDVRRTLDGRRDRRRMQDELEQRLALRRGRRCDRLRDEGAALVEIVLDLESIARRTSFLGGSDPGPGDGQGGPMPEGFGNRRPIRIDVRNLAVEQDLKLWFEHEPYLEPSP